MRRPLGLMGTAALALVLIAQPAWAQRPPPEHPVFGHTLMNGTGFIATPHAFVDKGSLFTTGTIIVRDKYSDDIDFNLLRGAVGLGLGRLLEVGGTVHYSKAFSLFGKLQLVRQSGVYPAIAAGVHNLTTADIGRFGKVDTLVYKDVLDAASFYGVFTYVVGPGRGSFPSWVLISGGWGTGIFEKNNPQFEDVDRSGGFFGSVAFDFQAAEGALVRVVTEYDGFDLNLAGTVWLSGLELTLGLLSLGQSDPPEPLQEGEPYDPTRTATGHFYNQVKAFASLTLDFRALGKLPWVWTSGEE